VLKTAIKKFGKPGQKIVVHGESLGGMVACDIALRSNQSL